MKIKVTAKTFGNDIVELFDDWNEAKNWMKLTDQYNVPHEYKDELYPVKFEVETIWNIEMRAEDFDELKELVEELPVEDVKEDE